MAGSLGYSLTYTPQYAAISNIQSISAAIGTAIVACVGDVVTVFGAVNVSLTDHLLNGEFSISLPIEISAGLITGLVSGLILPAGGSPSVMRGTITAYSNIAALCILGTTGSGSFHTLIYSFTYKVKPF